MPFYRLMTTLLSFVFGLACLQAQENMPYPKEYYGGGIGYTPTFLMLNVAEAFPFSTSGGTDTDLLGSSGLGFSDAEISQLGNMMVLHGAEGFGNVSGHWRVGAYVGLGSNSISRVDTTNESRVDLKTTLMTGNGSLELVIPIFSNLEVSAGSLFGLDRAIIQFTRASGNPLWDAQFAGTDTSNKVMALSGTFFSYQPYIAIKLQFMDRAGLRISGGYRLGSLAANQWSLNDFKNILAPGKSDFSALAVRVMFYLGI